MNRQEGNLILEYLTRPNPQRRCVVIRDYARLMHMSEGRAEDALDLWAYLFLGQHREFINPPGGESR
jgi:hypothetical protein